MTDEPKTTPDTLGNLGDLLKNLGKALTEAASAVTVESYIERRAQAMPDLLAVARSPQILKHVYEAARSADLNRDGKIEGEAEQAALISAMTGIEAKPFEKAKKDIEAACSRLPDPSIEALMATLSQHYYRDFHVDKKLTEGATGRDPGAALEAYLRERESRTADVGVHAMIAPPRESMSPANYEALIKKLQQVDREFNTVLATELLATFATHPDVREAAERLPEPGNLVPLPAQSVCKSASGLRL